MQVSPMHARPDRLTFLVVRPERETLSDGFHVVEDATFGPGRRLTSRPVVPGHGAKEVLGQRFSIDRAEGRDSALILPASTAPASDTLTPPGRSPRA